MASWMIDSVNCRGPLSVAVVQMQSSEDRSENIDQLLSQLESLGDLNAIDLVVFPENSLHMQVSSFDPTQRLAFDLTEPVFKKLQAVAKASDLTMTLGVTVKEGQTHFNATVRVGSKQGPEVVYRKMHLFDVDVSGEKSVRESDQFAHGEQPSVIECKGWKLGLSICYDLRFSNLYSHYAHIPVDALLVPSAFLVTTGKAHWEVLLRARAIEFQSYVLAPAQGGIHKGKDGKTRETYGHSMIVDPWGEIMAQKPTPGLGALTATLDPVKLEKVRSQIPMQATRRDNL